MLWVLWRHDRDNCRNFLRITIWHACAAPFWIAGAFTDAQRASRALGDRGRHRDRLRRSSDFWVPGLGRSTTTDWNVEGAHMAERCGLFVIIALGESILITGATAAGLPWNVEQRRRIRGRIHGQRRDVGGLFQHRRGAGEPTDRVVRRSGPAGALGLHLHPHPDRRRHHPRGGRRRAGAAAPVAATRAPARSPRSSAGRRSISPAMRCSSGCRRPTCRSRTLWDSDCWRCWCRPGFTVSPLVLAAGATAVLIIVVIWEWMSLRPRTAT